MERWCQGNRIIDSEIAGFEAALNSPPEAAARKPPRFLSDSSVAAARRWRLSFPIDDTAVTFDRLNVVDFQRIPELLIEDWAK